ncbi:hypothetical protein CVT26_005291 [Gymnopilus dilepis]|uniref:Uncharacterized protein n=1 Tax=Gymnopilus dilepis TaxID=231916 RepID=A0A409YSS7_9AGAR|nr:hypothetical protein CVT26_005291 [Gymnopilus dilepis]
MHFAILSFFTVFSLFVGALSAPVELVRRGPDLAISLRETGKNTANWHFALVVHSTGAVFTGKYVPIHEFVLHDGCLVYDSRTAPTTDRQIVDTAKIIPKNGEATDADLEKAVEGILKTNEKSTDPLTDPKYKNCFDYAIGAVQELEKHGYVSPADYGKFKAYYEHKEGGKEYHEVVREKTYPGLKSTIEAQAKASKP